jgi:two-component system, cell cycle response regulator
LKILLVEDSAIDRHVITQHLKSWGFKVSVATSGTRARKILEGRDAPRLVLLDWMLPDVDGIQLCRDLRRRGANEPYVYVVMVTAREKKKDLLKAMEAGADDYLVKPVDSIELKARLLAGRRIVGLHEQLLLAGDFLRFAATHDPLTGLWNRGEILNFLRRELVRADRERRPLAIVIVDVDHFKKLNDTFGHLAGDSVLKEIGKRLQSGVRVYDGIGRYGGEEFLLVLPGCDLKPATARAESLRSLVSDKPITVSSTEVTVTVSLGVTALCSSDGTLEEVLQRADAAMYEAKAKGRNRVEGISKASKTVASHAVEDKSRQRGKITSREVAARIIRR